VLFVTSEQRLPADPRWCGWQPVLSAVVRPMRAGHVAACADLLPAWTPFRDILPLGPVSKSLAP